MKSLALLALITGSFLLVSALAQDPGLSPKEEPSGEPPGPEEPNFLDIIISASGAVVVQSKTYAHEGGAPPHPNPDPAPSPEGPVPREEAQPDLPREDRPGSPVHSSVLGEAPSGGPSSPGGQDDDPAEDEPRLFGLPLSSIDPPPGSIKVPNVTADDLALLGLVAVPREWAFDFPFRGNDESVTIRYFVGPSGVILRRSILANPEVVRLSLQAEKAAIAANLLAAQDPGEEGSLRVLQQSPAGQPLPSLGKRPLYIDFSKETQAVTLSVAGAEVEDAAIAVQFSTDLVHWRTIGQWRGGKFIHSPMAPGSGFYRAIPSE